MTLIRIAVIVLARIQLHFTARSIFFLPDVCSRRSRVQRGGRGESGAESVHDCLEGGVDGMLRRRRVVRPQHFLPVRPVREELCQSDERGER